MSTSITLDAEVILTWVTLVIAVVGAVITTSRWMVRSLDHKIKELTLPIQPGTNGGNSLSDVARAVQSSTEANERAMKRLHERIDILSESVHGLQVWANGRPCLQHDRYIRGIPVHSDEE